MTAFQLIGLVLAILVASILVGYAFHKTKSSQDQDNIFEEIDDLFEDVKEEIEEVVEEVKEVIQESKPRKRKPRNKKQQ